MGEQGTSGEFEAAETLALADSIDFAQTLAAHNISRDGKPRDTVGRRVRTEGSAVSASLGQLPKLRVGREAMSGAAADYVVLDELGAGGMGVVELAAQTALGREVAMKRVHAAGGDPEAFALLHEARITGHLEHPNIVPVHVVGVDPGRGPVVVMKRILGVSWLDLIVRGDTSMTRHIEILMQVCNAASFAHSKGIAHCDLKPENVMVGDFGEVYVVDWGIATRVGEGGDWGPRGTPGYMAPELALGMGEAIDGHTDVYLLGACLHEVLTGELRHEGADLLAVIQAAVHSAPASYAADVPVELGAVCNRACQRMPEDRYPDATALRAALQSYLDDRSARELTAAAMSRLEALEATIADARAASTEVDEPALQALFRESQFAFQHVLETRPGLSEAEVGLERCLTSMFGYELARRDRKGAEALLHAMKRPTKQAREQLAALQEEADAAKRRIAALEHDADASIAQPERSRVGALLTGVGVLTVGALFLSNRSATKVLSRTGLVVIALVLWVIGFGCFAFWRKQLLANEYSRRRLHLPLGCLSAMLVNRCLGLWLEAPVQHIAIGDLLLLATVSLMSGWMARIYYLAAAVLVALAMLVAWQPATMRIAVNLGVLALSATVWWQWRKPPPAA